MQVSAIQMVSAPDLEVNLIQAEYWVGHAAAEGARLVLLPEYFCFMGHGERDKLALRETDGEGPIQDRLSALARRHGVWLAAGTMPMACPDPDRVFNTMLVFGPDGSRVARYDKIHLFNFQRGQESYDEARAIQHGQHPVTLEIEGYRVGLSVCYDLRFPELFRAMGDLDLILLPAAFTYTTGQAHWSLLLRARAVENQCYVLASAQGGHHANGRRTWGHSMLVDPWGEVVDEVAQGEAAIGGTIDPLRLAQVRESLPAWRHRVL